MSRKHGGGAGYYDGDGDFGGDDYGYDDDYYDYDDYDGGSGGGGVTAQYRPPAPSQRGGSRSGDASRAKQQSAATTSTAAGGRGSHGGESGWISAAVNAPKKSGGGIVAKPASRKVAEQRHKHEKGGEEGGGAMKEGGRGGGKVIVKAAEEKRAGAAAAAAVAAVAKSSSRTPAIGRDSSARLNAGGDGEQVARDVQMLRLEDDADDAKVSPSSLCSATATGGGGGGGGGVVGGGQSRRARPSLPLDSYVPEAGLEAAASASKDGKELLHLIVIGHVDSGKSTIMGRMLHLLGQVSQKEMHKNEREAKQQGKGSFAYAWVLDEGAEERSRGVTMTVAVAHFETGNRRVVLLDAPGHKDFVPNMIAGASQADAAVLVVDATPGGFEAGFDAATGGSVDGGGSGTGTGGVGGGGVGGQTREHAQLARSLGVEQLIVAVNKMDVVGYDKRRFDQIRATLGPFLKTCGFRDGAVRWVPVSAMEGQNLKDAPSVKDLTSWYNGPTLLEGINGFSAPTRQVAKPLRLPIAEIVRSSRSLGAVAVGGKVEGGGLRVGTRVVVMPSDSPATVRAMERNEQAVPVALAGESVDVGLTGVDAGMLLSGGVLCHPDYPVPVVQRFEARILVLGIKRPILKGVQVILHAHTARESAIVTQLIALLDSQTGAVAKQRPRCLTANKSAVIEVSVERGVCLELYTDYRPLGRVILREGGITLAVGIVTRIVS